MIWVERINAIVISCGYNWRFEDGRTDHPYIGGLERQQSIFIRIHDPLIQFL